MEQRIAESVDKVSVEKLMSQWALDQSERQEKALVKLREIAPKYIKQGLTSIHIEYSGCGDSGEITEIYGMVGREIHKPEKREWNDEKNWYRVAGADFDDIAYDILTYDWYNNDGGHGNIAIDLEAGTVSIDAYQTITESAPADYQKADLSF